MFHLLESQQFTKKKLRELFDLTTRMESILARGDEECLKGKILASLYFTPSLRTRFSFEAAMLRLGGSILSTEAAGIFSSELKGRFEDTIRVVSEMSDIIVLRHYESGFAKRAAAVSYVPVINAGDGPAQHPTQALVDLYTIDRHLGGVDGCSIAMIGDVSGRTVRSLCYFLAKFHGVSISFISPDLTEVKDDIKEYLQRHKVRLTEVTNPKGGLEELVKEVDVVHITQLSKEYFADRLEDYKQTISNYALNEKALSVMKKSAVIMHPLPRAEELPDESDSDPRAIYFRQNHYGLCLRMAILSTVLNCYPRFL
jgi:aspartate carbamoyltransferase catalytic subunit